jgi:predicted Fe-Mo cluster-binding NifX family protein
MQQKGVTIMLAGKLPEFADEVCKRYGIKVHLGYSGNVHMVVEKFLLENKYFQK